MLLAAAVLVTLGAVVLAVADLSSRGEEWDGFGAFIALLLGVPALCVAVTAGLALRWSRTSPPAAGLLAVVLGGFVALAPLVGLGWADVPLLRPGTFAFGAALVLAVVVPAARASDAREIRRVTSPLLVVEHEAECPPGWLGEWWEADATPLDVRRPWAGDALPEDLSAHAGMVVLGGAMGADDDAKHPWLTRVKVLVRAAAADGVPVLGVCLGHQLAAVALGGAVAPNPAGQQVGVLPVGWTDAAAGDALLGPLSGPARAVQWNNDVVTELPPGAVVLAVTAAGELQAARFAPTVWGVQWHPEAGVEIIGPWAEQDRDDAVERGVDLDRYVRDVADAGDEMRRTWRGLATGFAALAHDAVAAR